MKNVGKFLVALGLGLAGLFSFFPDVVTAVPFLKGTQLAYVLVSLAIILIGALLISTAYMRVKTTEFMERLNKRYHLKERIAVAADIDGIVDMARRNFGGAQDSDRDDSLYVHGLDQKFLHVIEQEVRQNSSSTKLQIVGYHLIYRLTAAGEQAVLDGAFNAARPPADHIARKRDKCVAIYIGAVVAQKVAARSYALACVQQRTKHDIRFRSAKVAYARAFTRDGLRTLNQWQFVPIRGSKIQIGSIFSRPFKDIRDDEEQYVAT